MFLGPPRRARTLRATVLRSFGVPVGFVLGLVAATALAPTAMHYAEVPASTDMTVRSPASVSTALVLADEHGCWTGPAPVDMEGKVPGHAVVTWPGADEAAYGGRRAVEAALEHVFEGRHPRLRVHAFCR